MPRTKRDKWPTPKKKKDTLGGPRQMGTVRKQDSWSSQESKVKTFRNPAAHRKGDKKEEKERRRRRAQEKGGRAASPGTKGKQLLHQQRGT